LKLRVLFSAEFLAEQTLSGDSAKIENWRNEQAIKRTEAIRPDLLK
jgi:tRNA G37 N-methylase TrmD